MFSSRLLRPVFTMECIAWPFAAALTVKAWSSIKVSLSKTDSNDKSQQYATQHLSNKTGQSIKKIKSSKWYEALIKQWGELIILLGDSLATQVGSLAPDLRLGRIFHKDIPSWMASSSLYAHQDSSLPLLPLPPGTLQRRPSQDWMPFLRN